MINNNDNIIQLPDMSNNHVKRSEKYHEIYIITMLLLNKVNINSIPSVVLYLLYYVRCYVDQSIQIGDPRHALFTL